MLIRKSERRPERAKPSDAERPTFIGFGPANVPEALGHHGRRIGRGG